MYNFGRKWSHILPPAWLYKSHRNKSVREPFSKVHYRVVCLEMKALILTHYLLPGNLDIVTMIAKISNTILPTSKCNPYLYTK